MYGISFSAFLKEKLRIFINSIGGSIWAAFKIYNLIIFSAVPIETVAVSKTNSSSFFILQAGRRRLAFPTARMKFHQAAYPQVKFKKLKELNAEALANNVATLRYTDAVQRFAFTARCRRQTEVLKLFYTNAVLSSKKAKKLGLIDEIVEPQKRPR